MSDPLILAVLAMNMFSFVLTIYNQLKLRKLREDYMNYQKGLCEKK